MGSLFGGGGGGNQMKAMNDYIKQVMIPGDKWRLEEEQWRGPFAREAVQRQAGIAGGAYPSLLQTIMGPGVFQTALPAHEREAIERQFSNANRNILATSPARGGQLNALRAGMERDRASTVGLAQGQARQRGVERAMPFISASYGPIGQTTPANTGATASALGGLAGMQQQNQMSNLMGIGQLAGTLLGGGGGGGGGGFMGGIGNLLGLFGGGGGAAAGGSPAWNIASMAGKFGLGG